MKRRIITILRKNPVNCGFVAGGWWLVAGGW